MATATRVKTTDSSVVPAGEYGYPVGHLGHLSEAQETALEEFRKLCAESGVYKPATEASPASHDDVMLLYCNFSHIVAVPS
jgi:hypothetical protein